MVVKRFGKSKSNKYGAFSAKNTAVSAAGLILSAVLVFAFLLLINNLLINYGEQSKLDEISQSYVSAKDNAISQSGSVLAMLPGFEELYNMNSDFCGWISIDGTNINYPVMNSAYEPELYLNRSFNGTQNVSGTPFVGQAYSLDTAYAVIYAHNLQNGIMFSSLPYYESDEYRRGHRYVNISSLYEQRTYEVFAACECNVEDTDPAAFRFYSVQPYPDERSFYRMTYWFKRHSYYDTGIDPIYGEQVIVLATCSNTDENNRFLVALKKM